MQVETEALVHSAMAYYYTLRERASDGDRSQSDRIVHKRQRTGKAVGGQASAPACEGLRAVGKSGD